MKAGQFYMVGVQFADVKATDTVDLNTLLSTTCAPGEIGDGEDDTWGNAPLLPVLYRVYAHADDACEPALARREAAAYAPHVRGGDLETARRLHLAALDRSGLPDAFSKFREYVVVRFRFSSTRFLLYEIPHRLQLGGRDVLQFVFEKQKIM